MRGFCKKIKTILKKIKIKIKLFFRKLRYKIKGIFAKEIIDLSYEQARKNLEEFSKKPNGTSLRKNAVAENPEYDLQIIVPAYNVEKYLEECINSILNQKTKYSFLLVIVDDGSTDNTSTILKNYENQKDVLIIHQENRGLAGARNRALEVINAKYVIFVDSDDVLCENAIESLLKTAETTNADIVCGGYYYLKNDTLSVFKSFEKTREIKYNKLNGESCGKLYASNILKNICYPDHYMFEDTIGSFLLYPSATKIYAIKSMIYQYRMQNNSIIHTYTKKNNCVDTYWITELLVNERKELGLPSDKLYYNRIIEQIIMNQGRIQNVPEIIKKSIFILTKNLIENNFSQKLFANKHKRLVKALCKSDYGKFVILCKSI